MKLGNQICDPFHNNALLLLYENVRSITNLNVIAFLFFVSVVVFVVFFCIIIIIIIIIIGKF